MKKILPVCILLICCFALLIPPAYAKKSKIDKSLQELNRILNNFEFTFNTSTQSKWVETWKNSYKLSISRKILTIDYTVNFTGSRNKFKIYQQTEKGKLTVLYSELDPEGLLLSNNKNSVILSCKEDKECINIESKDSYIDVKRNKTNKYTKNVNKNRFVLFVGGETLPDKVFSNLKELLSHLHQTESK